MHTITRNMRSLSLQRFMSQTDISTFQRPHPVDTNTVGLPDSYSKRHLRLAFPPFNPIVIKHASDLGHIANTFVVRLWVVVGK
jgi:hypothetical protein